MSKDIKKVSKDKIKASNISRYKTAYKPKKYHSAFLNIVNKDAHSSRPETVGKLATEIFPNYLDNAIEPSPENWKKYYHDNYSEQYDKGLEKLKRQFELEKQAINAITEQDLVDYYDDLMFDKTFSDLYVQDEILIDIADKKKATYRKPDAIEVILSISLDTFSTQNSKQVRNPLFEMEKIYMERSGMDICSISVAA